MSQLRHILRSITVCLSCLAATASKVEQDATSGRSLTQLSLSLEKWGSKTLSSVPELPLHVSPNIDLETALSSVAELPLHASPNIGSAVKLYGLLRATSSQKTGSQESRNVLITIILVWLVLAIGCIFRPWGEASHGSIKLLPPEPPEETSHPPPNGQYTQPSSCSSLQPTSERCASERSFNAQYRESKDEDKEALALLVRCNIIEADQFDTIHQEHIDECVWIAKQMLQQNRLEDWVALDRGTILSTVDAHLAARSDARANVFRNAAEADVPRIQGHRNAMRTESGGSIASSQVSFGVEEFSGPPAPMPPMPCMHTDPLSHKSPVPLLHCDQSAVDHAFSDGDCDQYQEDAFPSVITYSTPFPSVITSSGFHQQSSQGIPPGFSPPESMRLMTRPDFSPLPPDKSLAPPFHNRVSLPVRDQEVMSAPPQAFQERLQTGFGPASASSDALVGVRPMGQLQRPSHQYNDPMVFTFGSEAASSSQPAPNFRSASPSFS